MTDREKAAAARRIERARAKIRRLELDLQEARGQLLVEARRMREQGATLQEVADALGFTRQRAHALVGDVDRG